MRQARRHRQEGKGGRGASIAHKRRRTTGYIGLPAHISSCPRPMSAPDLSSPTPASERSVYFDAPIIHIFSRNKPDDKPVITNADDDTPVPAAAHTGNPQSSVAIPPEPIANGHHDVEHDATPEPDEHNFAGTDTTPPSDSGYGLPSPTSPTRTGTRAPQRSASRASRASLKSMPVVWTDGEPAHADDETHPDSGADRRARRAASVRSTRSSASRRDRDDRESIRSTAASRFSERRRASLSGGSFAAGAGSIGPGSTPRPDETEEFDLRARNAEADLSPKQKSKIEKASGMLAVHGQWTMFIHYRYSERRKASFEGVEVGSQVRGEGD